MPCWYYDKKELRNTPSKSDGISYETEMRYRKEGARFIIDTGTKMDLGCNTTATGVVYFHRFYMFHSFKQFPRYVTACCCLFLAGKVEETPKKCKDIIKTARSFLSDQKFMQFGEDPKEEVMTLERILLQTIKFDLQVEHPYNYLIKYANCFKGDKKKLRDMVQMAWTFVNDSLCTTLALQWEPEIIAVALMYLACKLRQFEVVDWAGRLPQHLRWWDMFIEDITMDLLEDICHQVLDLYQSPPTTAPDSPPPHQMTSAAATAVQTPVTPIKATTSNGQDKAPPPAETSHPNSAVNSAPGTPQDPPTVTPLAATNTVTPTSYVAPPPSAFIGGPPHHSIVGPPPTHLPPPAAVYTQPPPPNFVSAPPPPPHFQPNVGGYYPHGPPPMGGHNRPPYFK